MISRQIVKLFALFLLIELASLIFIDQPLMASTLAFTITLIVLWLSLKDIKFGFFAILLELILGGQGYLFHLSWGGASLSIRMLIFIVVFGVWLGKFLIKGDYQNKLKHLFGQWLYPYFGLLAVVALGFILGFKNHHGLEAILLDGNGYLYLLLAPIFL